MLLRPVRGKARSADVAGWAWVALLPCALTGCPLTDNYFVDPNAGAAGVAPSPGGSGPTGGDAGTAGGGAGGSGAIGGGTSGGTGGDGMGGASAATGGTDIGGNAAVGATAGSGETGGVGGTNAGGTGGAAEAGAGGVAPEGCAASEHDGHAYILCMSPTVVAGSTYDAAYARCAGLAAELGRDETFDLVSIEDDEENTFLKDWIAEGPTVPDAAVWTGANDLELENTWVWGRGASAVQFFRGYAAGGGLPFMARYNDFGPGKPNSSNGTDEDCGAFDSAIDWQWNDRECARKQIGFICEQQP